MKKTYRDRHASSIKCTFLQDTCLRARGCSKSSPLLCGHKGFAYQVLLKRQSCTPLRSLSTAANLPRTGWRRDTAVWAEMIPAYMSLAAAQKDHDFGHYIPAGPDSVSTGEPASAEGIPAGFRTPMVIGAQIGQPFRRPHRPPCLKRTAAGHQPPQNAKEETGRSPPSKVLNKTRGCMPPRPPGSPGRGRGFPFSGRPGLCSTAEPRPLPLAAAR